MNVFRQAIDASEPPFAALYLHGPGGVGKISLLDALKDLVLITNAGSGT